MPGTELKASGLGSGNDVRRTQLDAGLSPRFLSRDNFQDAVSLLLLFNRDAIVEDFASEYRRYRRR